VFTIFAFTTSYYAVQRRAKSPLLVINKARTMAKDDMTAALGVPAGCPAGPTDSVSTS
jgi:hypothetical protein